MKTTHNPALIAAALLLTLGSAAAFAGGAKPLAVDFDKCFAHAGVDPYVLTFAGMVSGDAVGPFEARIVVYLPGVEPGQTHIQADYVVTGTLPFTARVGGRVDDATRRAVLRGYVSVGPAWLLGAGVHDEFVNYTRADGAPCSRGTLYITPRWKQSHGEGQED